MVAEGVETVASVLALARPLGVAMPICEAVAAVLFGGQLVSGRCGIARPRARRGTRPTRLPAAGDQPAGMPAGLSSAVARWSAAGSSSRPSGPGAPPTSRPGRRRPRLAARPQQLRVLPGRESRTPTGARGAATGALPTPGLTVRVRRTSSPRRIEGARALGRGPLRPDQRGRRARGDHRSGPRRRAGDPPGGAGRDVVRAYRDRMRDLRRDPRFEYVIVFKNHGERAGASLEHPHSQLIATPTLPSTVEEELAGALRHFRIKKRCIWCDIVHQERRGGGRVVADDGAFVALAPFAPRFPFETWILPAEHRSSFEEIDGADLLDLARVLRDVLGRMRRVPTTRRSTHAPLGPDRGRRGLPLAPRDHPQAHAHGRVHGGMLHNPTPWRSPAVPGEVNLARPLHTATARARGNSKSEQLPRLGNGFEPVSRFVLLWGPIRCLFASGGVASG